MNKCRIYTILICGIPAIGKTYLSKKIVEFYKGNKVGVNCLHMSFDNITNINQDNYFKFKEMRDDFVNKYKMTINTAINKDESILIILDDNFYLKSMRKKIYQSMNDIIDNEERSGSFDWFYGEIFLQCSDINYILTQNEERKEKIPNEIITKMNTLFEYSSPYLSNPNSTFTLSINNKSLLHQLNYEELFTQVEKCCLIKREKGKSIQSEIISKDSQAQFIDLIELKLRQSINQFMKTNKNKSINGKVISNKKKEYMSILISHIHNLPTKESITDTEMRDILTVLHSNQYSDELSNKIINYFINVFIFNR